MKIRKLIALLATLLLVVTPMTAIVPASVSAEMGGDFPWTDESEKMLIEEILERDGLIDGIWFPWFNGGQTGHNLTGNDLMADYYNSSSTKNWDRVELDYYGADKIYREIYNLKAMGYNILAYGGSIFGEGVIFDENGDVLGIKEEYLNNARRLLNMCREIGMPVMWNVYFHDSSMPSYYGMEGWHVICQMLGNNEIADHYAERFVRPLCEMLAEYPDVVALVSIADEPENQINDLGKGDHFDTKGREMYGVNQDDMIYFMQQINEVVREELPNVARTVASNSGNKTIYRDFDLDLMGHNQYTDGDSFKSIESLITDGDVILSEYNVGSVMTDDTAYANKLIQFRQWMIDNGYKGGFQWCWMPNSNRNSSYALQSSTTDPTAFRKTVALLKYFMDEYRAEYRGETLGLVAPVLYANDTSKKVLKFIPSQLATKITIQRSDDGGNTWKTLVSNVSQSTYVNSDLVGSYTDSDTSRPTTGYCYRIIAKDANGNTVTSEPNNIAGSDLAFKKTYVAPSYTKGKYYITSSLKEADAKLTSFGVEKNRPLSDAVNLIQNGSFESTGGQWNNSSFLQYAQVVSDSTTPDGSKSLYFDTSANGNEGWYTFTVTGLKANTEYTFSSFIKGAYLSDSNKGQASIGVIDPDTGKYMFYWNYFSSYPRASRETKQMYPTAYDNEWHIRSVTFNTGSLTTATIALYGYSSQIWVDGLALFETVNGMKYENGESAKAIVSTEYSPASGATNAVTDPAVNNASYWNTGAGYKQGFMSIASGKLKYTASSDPVGVRYTKWIDVKPGTDYYYSYTVNVTSAGNGRVAILDNAMLLPHEVVTTAFSSTGTKTVTGRISTGKYDKLGLCVVDLGGVATVDNIYLYEGDASVVLPTTPSYDGYIINGDFEIGSSNNWENLWDNNTVEMVTGRDSAFAMKGTAGGQYTQVRQKITVEPGTDYIIEVWAKNVTGTTLIVKDSTDANLKQTGLLGSGSTWTKTTLEFNSGSHTFIYLGFMGSSAGNTWTVDDVKMYKKPTASFDGYLSNGDFEMQGQDWAFNSGSHAFVSDAHGGNYALQLTNPGMWAEGAIQTVTVEPNTSYTITWWYKATSGTGNFVLFVMDGVSFGNMTTVSGNQNMGSYTGGWQQGSYTVNTGSSTTMMLKFSTGGSNPGTILIDDVVVVKTEDAMCTHSYTAAVTKQPTCGATGVRTYTCSLCGDSYTETIPATGNHTYDNVCDTSCNVCGATRTVSHVYSGACDTSCNVCGNLRLLISAKHTYSYDCDATCDVCGFTRTGVEHYYVSTVTKQPTCTEPGVKTYTCYWGCGASYTEAIEPTGEHAYKAVVTDPDCVNGGYTTYTCTVCGDSYKGDYTDALGHSWIAADCDTAKTCSVCGETEGEALGHSYKGVVTEPDCVNGGYTTYTCTACGDSYKGNYTAALGHSWIAADCDTPKTCSVCGTTEGEALGHKYDNDCDADCNTCGATRTPADHQYVESIVANANCGYDGMAKHTCSVCGDSYITAISATGAHKYSNDCDNRCNVCNKIREVGDHRYVGVETKTPTCTETGVTTYTCSSCGVSYTEAIPVVAHSYNAVVTAPDCVNGGYTTYTCSACGDSYKGDYTSALGHTPGAAADCENDQICTVCGEILNAALGHSYKTVVTEPDCVNGGYTTYTCSACGDSYKGNYTEALGHSWIAADCDTAKTCSVCGETEGEALGHSYNAVVTEPDCVNGGYTTYTCSACGDSYKGDYTAALGHDWIAADCDTAKTCSVCGATEGEALGHSYKAVVTAPDCVNGGYTTYTCSACGHSYKGDYTSALGHSWIAADCDTAKTCSVCGATEGEALGHSYNAVVTAPDCVNGGYTTYTCSACGDSYKGDYTAALGHSWIAADCDTAKTCSVCGATEGEALGHKYDNDCDASCNVCGGIREVADHVYTDDFDTTCNECGTVRDVVAPASVITFGGNSVTEEIKTGAGLAFKFDVAVNDMRVNGTTAIYDNATVNGYKLISMGAIVTNGASTVDIPAVYLCDLEAVSAAFAVRVIHIPAEKLDVEITATPYIVLEINGVATTIYGEAQTSSYNEALNG